MRVRIFYEKFVFALSTRVQGVTGLTKADWRPLRHELQKISLIASPDSRAFIAHFLKQRFELTLL